MFVKAVRDADTLSAHALVGGSALARCAVIERLVEAAQCRFTRVLCAFTAVIATHLRADAKRPQALVIIGAEAFIVTCNELRHMGAAVHWMTSIIGALVAVVALGIQWDVKAACCGIAEVVCAVNFVVALPENRVGVNLAYLGRTFRFALPAMQGPITQVGVLKWLAVVVHLAQAPGLLQLVLRQRIAQAFSPHAGVDTGAWISVIARGRVGDERTQIIGGTLVVCARISIDALAAVTLTGPASRTAIKSLAQLVALRCTDGTV